jgi:hypothetical protein
MGRSGYYQGHTWLLRQETGCLLLVCHHLNISQHLENSLSSELLKLKLNHTTKLQLSSLEKNSDVFQEANLSPIGWGSSRPRALGRCAGGREDPSSNLSKSEP